MRYTARRTQAYVHVYTALARGDSKLRFTITAMEQEREGEIERLRSGKPRRHIGLQKDLGYSRRSCEVKDRVSPPANDGATWPFPTSDATWEPQACICVQLRNKPALSMLFLVGSH